MQLSVTDMSLPDGIFFLHSLNASSVIFGFSFFIFFSHANALSTLSALFLHSIADMLLHSPAITVGDVNVNDIKAK